MSQRIQRSFDSHTDKYTKIASSFCSFATQLQLPPMESSKREAHLRFYASKNLRAKNSFAQSPTASAFPLSFSPQSFSPTFHLHWLPCLTKTASTKGHIKPKSTKPMISEPQLRSFNRLSRFAVIEGLHQ